MCQRLFLSPLSLPILPWLGLALSQLSLRMLLPPLL